MYVHFSYIHTATYIRMYSSDLSMHVRIPTHDITNCGMYISTYVVLPQISNALTLCNYTWLHKQNNAMQITTYIQHSFHR